MQHAVSLDSDPLEESQEDDLFFEPQSPDTINYYEDLAKERYNESLKSVMRLQQERENIERNIHALELLLSELESTDKTEIIESKSQGDTIDDIPIEIEIDKDRCQVE